MPHPRHRPCGNTGCWTRPRASDSADLGLCIPSSQALWSPSQTEGRAVNWPRSRPHVPGATRDHRWLQASLPPAPSDPRLGWVPPQVHTRWASPYAAALRRGCAPRNPAPHLLPSPGLHPTPQMALGSASSLVTCDWLSPQASPQSHVTWSACQPDPPKAFPSHLTTTPSLPLPGLLPASHTHSHPFLFLSLLVFYFIF